MSEKKWDTKNIINQQGKTVLITGANAGIGFEAALALAQKDAEVILAVRNPEKGNRAMGKILEKYSPAKVRVMDLDLANLESVKNFAQEFTSAFSTLNILINNAGVMIPPFTQTADGFELQMGTNHLGHFALTALLFPVLRKTPGARIVNVASMAHKRGNINLEDLNWQKRSYNAFLAYGDSKLANLLFTYELARRLDKANAGILSVAAHPGWSDTELMRHNNAFEILARMMAQSQEMGALPTLYAAVNPEVKNGDYIGPSGFMEIKGYPKKVTSNAASHDTKKAEKLWELSEKMTQIPFSV